MSLLDHFHPPLSQRRHWESFHAAWATTLADRLNERIVPQGYFAEELITVGGRVEIDVATFEDNGAPRAKSSTATLAPKLWAPPAPTDVMPAVFPDTYAVQVYKTEGGPTLVATIELVSPGNKDRPASRLAFVTKCAHYLYQGLGLIVVDIVTSRQANLHNELVELLRYDKKHRMAHGIQLCAVAYRPIRRNETPEIDVWQAPLALSQALPTLPLALSGELCLPVDLEETYLDVVSRRIGGAD